MTVTADQISRLRRMTAEPTVATYSDASLTTYIEAHPLTDPYGYSPDDPDGYYVINPDWTPTYDLNAAAADIWEEKAGVLAQDYDFQADGASYTRSQTYQQAMNQVRHYRAKRSIKTIAMQASPKAPPSLGALDSDESN